jgi:hypothetical protein
MGNGILNVLEEGLMGEQSDYLELWIHYEDRGFDDKNRMISTASLLLSVSGGLLGASASVGAVGQRALAASGLALSLVSAVLVAFFRHHAERNFDAAELIRPHLHSNVQLVLNQIRPARVHDHQSAGLLRRTRQHFLGWLADTPRGAGTGRIFRTIFWLSLAMACVSAELMVRALNQ